VAHDFPETQWSQLLALGDRAHPRRPELMQRLGERYWEPVYHYVRALRRVSAEDAEDLTQQFFTTLLSRGDLEKLSPERGSFRGFLKTALRNALISADRAARARPALFPYEQAETAWQQHPDLGPDEAFDRAWARTVLLEGVARLREQLTAEGRHGQLAMFESYCLGDGAPTYAALAAQHGVTEDDVRNRLREARQRLRQILRKQLRETLAAGEDVESELAIVLGR
jgi:RNA polymerase sigma-70 factor (ECF subfamily)